MCEECHSDPHAPGCPNAPEPEPTYICAWHHRPVYEVEYYDLFGVKVCPACIEERKRLL